MTRPGCRVVFALFLTSVLLELSPRLTRQSGLNGDDRPTSLRAVVQRQISLCGSRCTCSYADRIINGQPYTDGEQGFGLCSTACSTDGCDFRPGVDGCGAILYLGCTDLDCRTSPPPVLPPMPGHTPPIVDSTPVPTVQPPPEKSDCSPPREWVELQHPRIARGFHWPPYPVLQSQVPPWETVPEVTFAVDVRGGKALRKVRRPETVCRGGGSYPDDCPDSGITRCRTRTQAVYPDPVVQVQATLQLTAESQSWINGYLASRYLRAHVRRPADNLQWTGSAMSRLVVLPPWDPQDPGRHTVRITATTAGTPISEPQSVSYLHPVDVSLRDTTLAP